MNFQKNGSNVSAVGLLDLRTDLGIERRLPNLGDAIATYRYVGTDVDVGMPNDGSPLDVSALFSSVPSTAVALEMCSSAVGAGDELFWSLASGRLNTAGADLTARAAANRTACRSILAGAPVLIPFVTPGVVPAGLRVATGVAGSPRLQVRLVDASSKRLPYLTASSTEFVMTGAGAAQQLPFSDTSRFPAGYTGASFQVIGSGVRIRFDGVPFGSSFGFPLPPGQWHIDFGRHGISVSSLRLLMPASTYIVGNSTKDQA